ncbi:MAG: NADH-quinone oxidoreductase subunit NuoH [Nitrososphaerales archaeon]|nr:NADH-quinone oxidoreductase subunit NuoH [Nitrososphaerota archaeon]
METFEDFLKRIIVVVFWLLLLLPFIIFPFIFIVVPALGIPLPTANQVLTALLDPLKALPLVNDLGLGPSSLFFKIAAFPGFTFAALVATGIILYERKLMAKVQVRVGPLYAGRFEGILQPIADLVKLLFKELLVPAKADKTFFFIAPSLSLALATALLAVIPLAPDIFIARSEVSLLIPFAIIGLTPLVILIAAWASSNKFAFIGGLRALHQLIAYEIPMMLSLVGVVILSGSLDLFGIVEAQRGLWFILPQLLGASIFYVTMLSELERIPFDLPEADTELVAGWLTEYSGMHFGLLQLATYVKFYALAVLFTLIFLGGWIGPAFLPPFAWLLIKLFFVITFMLLPRAFMPRVRMDQLIRLGWVWLIMLAFVNLFIALVQASIGVIL